VTVNGPLDFHAIFEAAPLPNLIVRADPRFTIIAANDAYLCATMTTRERIVGRPNFEAFPDNPYDPAATGVRKVSESIGHVVAHRQPHTMAVRLAEPAWAGPPDADAAVLLERMWQWVASHRTGP
jgi:hypothetical protein